MNSLRKFRQLGSLLVALCFVSSSGGALFLLQSLAWGQMLWDFSRTLGTKTAIAKTFDGKHPCGRCHEIGKSESKKTALPTSELQRRYDPHLVRPIQVDLRLFSEAISYPIEFNLASSQIGASPPLPPPRIQG